MTDSPRRRMRRSGAFGSLIVAAVAMVSLVLSSGTALADVDSADRIVDDNDLTVEAIQSDTSINFIPPLDGNPLTREWFHNGRAGFKISGDPEKAKDWSGTIIIGYQVGYPATFTGKLRFSWYTPNLSLDLSNDGGPTLSNLLPSLGMELEVGFGPGIATVEAAKGEISGDEGFIRLANFHGTVTGVVGQTNIRPFVTIISSGGDSVTTYGRPWSI